MMWGLVCGLAWAVDGDMGAGTQPLTDGSTDYPYLIEDVNDFDVFASDSGYWAAGVHTQLMTDIDLAGRIYTAAVIAPDTHPYISDFQGLRYSGVFHGQGFAIHNLTIDTASTLKSYLGLFGSIEGVGAEVNSLAVIDCNIVVGDEAIAVGALSGYVYQGNIIDCFSTGSVQARNNCRDIGGLCGCYLSGEFYGYTGIFTNCHSSVSVFCEDDCRRVGGLSGDCGYRITNCYANGLVTCGHNCYDIGGLCGRFVGTLTSCYAKASISTGDSCWDIGGLCGEFIESLTNCYSSGSVSVGDNCMAGGLCGAVSGEMRNCYTCVSVSGGVNCTLGALCSIFYSAADNISNGYFYLFGGPDTGFGTALNEFQLIDASYFVGFDFAGNSGDGSNDDWIMEEGHCPKLSWQMDSGPLPPSPPVTTLSGRGHLNDPYRINTLSDFTEFRTNRGLNCGYYLLCADLDLDGLIFNTSVIDRLFGGYFNGDNHAIRNIVIDPNGSAVENLGLFSVVSASVSDLEIENIKITAGNNSAHVGGLCGYNWGGTLSNCTITGFIKGDFVVGAMAGVNDGDIVECNSYVDISGNRHVSGLVGCNDGRITRCSSAGVVTGLVDYTGGLAGYNTGHISDCHSSCEVTGDRCVGGLVGQQIHESSRLEYSFSTGSVSGRSFVGGLIGYNYSDMVGCYSTGPVSGSVCVGGGAGSSSGDIINCYSTSSVSGSSVAGFVGDNTGTGTITNCYAAGVVIGDTWSTSFASSPLGYIFDCFWDTEASGIGEPGDNQAGAVGKSTAEMMAQSTFVDWDFTNDWMMLRAGEDYPRLAWQAVFAGDIAGLYGADLVDVAYLGRYWGLDDCDGADDCGRVDIDGSGDVGLADLAAVADDWLQ